MRDKVLLWLARTYKTIFFFSLAYVAYKLVGLIGVICVLAGDSCFTRWRWDHVTEDEKDKLLISELMTLSSIILAVFLWLTT